MKLLRVFLVCVTVAFSLQVVAQVNLVPNGSFEEYESCPDANTCHGGIELATGWFEPIDCTTDLIHSCACPSGTCCPPNGVEPFGEGMIHMGLYGGGGFDTREYAAVRLIQPLMADSIYHFSVRLHLQHNQIGRVGSFGAFFSTDSVTDYSNFQSVMNLTPQLQRNPNDLMSDFSVWYLWEDTLIAGGEEEFMILGNFLPDSLTPSESPTWMVGSFYLVDDVNLVQIPAPKPDGVNELKVRFGVSPNPASSTVRIEYSGNLSPTHIRVCTVSGKVVKLIDWRTDLGVADLPSGTYFLQVTFDNGIVGTERLIIQR